MQPRSYENITLRFINQNSTPCLVLIDEDNFNLSTMLNLKQSMNVCHEHKIKPNHMNKDKEACKRNQAIHQKGHKKEHTTVNLGNLPKGLCLKSKARIM
jgi:hypothetical protein